MADISRDVFGVMPDGAQVDAFALTNAAGMRVVILTFGGVIQSVWVPDRDGVVSNVALGFADLDSYRERSPYFGALVGRYANRIAYGRFDLDGQAHQLTINEGPHHLHGGHVGFDKRVWSAQPFTSTGKAGLELEYVSPDGEEGYPGTLAAAIRYTLDEDSALRIDYGATTDVPTVINLTNHSYFNLAGEGSGSVYSHVAEINAGYFTPVDDTLIPTGEIAAVDDTPLDFRTPVEIGRRIRDDHPQLQAAGGYDHNFVLDRSDSRLKPAARVFEPVTGRGVSVQTTEPGVQFYVGGHLDGSLVGPSGRSYGRGDAFALEAQHFPDSPNHDNFPSTVLRPGREYASTTVYTFSTTVD